MITYGSDCSGLEAPYIALCNILGGNNVRHIFSCDSDKNVQMSIKANFVPEIFTDNVFADEIQNRPHVDVYTAGFPCQTFITVGRREGFDDDRGIVFFAIYEYVKHRQPTVCVLENVKGLLNHDQGRTFSTIISMLEDLGVYNIYHSVLSPHECGWPQHRSRVFIVCITKVDQVKDFEFPRKEPLKLLASNLLDPSKTQTDPLTPFNRKNLNIHIANVKRKYNKNIMKDYYFTDLGASAAFGKPMHQVVPCLKASRCKYYITKCKRFLTLEEIERVQGFPPLNIEVSDSQYLKQIGNSMCIPLLEKLFLNIFRSVGWIR